MFVINFLLKKIRTSSFVVNSARPNWNWEKSYQCRFFGIPVLVLDFLVLFQCSFCYYDTFSTFVAIVRVYENFCEIFRRLWSFQQFSDLVSVLIFLHYSRTKKVWKIIYPCSIWLGWIVLCNILNLEFDFLFYFISSFDVVSGFDIFYFCVLKEKLEKEKMLVFCVCAYFLFFVLGHLLFFKSFSFRFSFGNIILFWLVYFILLS